MQEKKPYHNEEFSWTVHDFSKPKKEAEEVKMEWPKEPERPRRNVNLDEPISFDIDVFKKRSEKEELPQPEKTPVAASVKEVKPAEESGEEPKGEVREDVSPEQKLRELAELTKKLKEQQNAERQAAAQSVMNSSRESAAAEAREESLRRADPFFDFSKTNIAFQDLLDQEYEKLQKRKEGVPYVESQWRYQPEEESQAFEVSVEEPVNVLEETQEEAE